MIINDSNINSKMLFIIKTAKDLYDKTIEDSAKKCKISKKEADILLFFSNNKQFDNASSVVLYRGFSKAYVSKALTLLEKRGLVELVGDSNDKRCQHVIIKKEANKKIKILKDGQRQFFETLREGITEEEFLLHVSIIEKISKNIIKKMKG